MASQNGTTEERAKKVLRELKPPLVKTVQVVRGRPLDGYATVTITYTDNVAMLPEAVALRLSKLLEENVDHAQQAR